MVAATTAPKAPAKRRTPTIFDPALAVWAGELFLDGVWRQTIRCDGSESAHLLTCDPDGGRASCDCKGYEFRGACKHTAAAPAILRVTAYNELATLTRADLRVLDAGMRRQFGWGGLARNIRYDVLGEAVAADLRREDVPAAIARGRAAVADLFDEAS